MWATISYPRLPMTAQPLPALTSGDPSAWDQALYAFLVEKGNRSGSRRTVESYSRMLWPFFADLGKTPDRVKSGHRARLSPSPPSSMVVRMVVKPHKENPLVGPEGRSQA